MMRNDNLEVVISVVDELQAINNILKEFDDTAYQEIDEMLDKQFTKNKYGVFGKPQMQILFAERKNIDTALDNYFAREEEIRNALSDFEKDYEIDNDDYEMDM